MATFPNNASSSLPSFYSESGFESGFESRCASSCEAVFESERAGDSSVRHDHPNDVIVRAVVNHLVESERHPEARFLHVVPTPHVARTRLDAIHDEVGAKIQKRKPPERWRESQANEKRKQGVHRAVERQRHHEIPIRRKLAEHVWELERKIGEEMLDLKDHQQKEQILKGRLTRQAVTAKMRIYGQNRIAPLFSGLSRSFETEFLIGWTKCLSSAPNQDSTRREGVLLTIPPDHGPTSTPTSPAEPSATRLPSSAPIKTSSKAESPLVSVIVNVVAPVAVLNQLPKYAPSMNPWQILAIALALPIGGAILNFARAGKIGLLPGFGALNVLVTGGLAAWGVGGIWFAIKEAFFPLLIGAFVLRTAFGAKPFAKTLLLNDSFVHTDRIHEALSKRGEEAEFLGRLKTSTLWIAGSFLMSAILNFVLALRIFVPLPATLSDAERTHALNQQVAEMTGLGFAVIAIPSMVAMGWIFWKLMSHLRSHTGLTDDQLFRG